MNNSDSTSQMSTEPASINKTVNPSNSQKMAIVLVLAVLATIILIIGTVGFISLFQSRNTNTAANSGVSKDVASNTIVPQPSTIEKIAIPTPSLVPVTTPAPAKTITPANTPQPAAPTKSYFNFSANASIQNNLTGFRVVNSCHDNCGDSGTGSYITFDDGIESATRINNRLSVFAANLTADGYTTIPNVTGSINLKTIGTVNIHGNTYYYNEVFFCKDTSCNPNDQTEALVVLGDQQVVNFSQTNDSKSYSDPTSGDGQIGIINKYRVMTLKGKPFAIDYEAGYNPKVSAASLMNLFTPLLQTLTVN